MSGRRLISSGGRRGPKRHLKVESEEGDRPLICIFSDVRGRTRRFYDNYGPTEDSVDLFVFPVPVLRYLRFTTSPFTGPGVRGILGPSDDPTTTK